EENKRQKLVEDDDDQNQADGRLQHFVDAPQLIAENGVAHKQGDSRGSQLLEHGHGERRAGAADAQAGLNLLLEDVDVVLKVARKKFAHLLVDAIDVRSQRQ